MTEAWLARSAKQQELVETLAREARDRADEAPSYEIYITEFLIAILRYIVTMNGGDLGVAPTRASRQFANMVPRIGRFCRVDSERNHVAYILFQSLESTVGSWAQRDYLHDQIVNPEAVFGASSAMHEVEED